MNGNNSSLVYLHCLTTQYNGISICHVCFSPFFLVPSQCPALSRHSVNVSSLNKDAIIPARWCLRIPHGTLQTAHPGLPSCLLGHGLPGGCCVRDSESVSLVRLEAPQTSWPYLEMFRPGMLYGLPVRFAEESSQNHHLGKYSGTS